MGIFGEWVLLLVVVVVLYGGGSCGGVAVDLDAKIDCTYYKTCESCVGSKMDPRPCEWTVGNDGLPGRCLKNYRDLGKPVQFYVKPMRQCLVLRSAEPVVVAPALVDWPPPPSSYSAATAIGYIILGMTIWGIAHITIIVGKMLRRQQPVEPSELEGELDEILAALDRGDHVNPNALQQASSDVLLLHRMTKRPISVLAEAQDGLVREGQLPPPIRPRQSSVVREDNMLLIPQRQVGDEDVREIRIVRQDDEVNVSIPANDHTTEVIADLPSFQEPVVVRRNRQGAIAQTLTSAATFGAPPAEPKRNASRPRLNYRV